MAKIAHINQNDIGSCRKFLTFIDEHFLRMSFDERVEKYQNYLQVKETLERLEKELQGDAGPICINK